ncbi:hypothetical protein CKO_03308 [Citrobacter koseri ATCC BAA-895]|uniref:Uncharacterized protein n=1 Tax=Citrobacter koseri (strain ATCC BAA-895 / CDC 4225-83 / SGSC4696) TaxID=290338 RepID=A8ALM9_CITK8|nr:hypothetical protein CKO_03308 [Citrobacter koseri ATCC BAA-895]
MPDDGFALSGLHRVTGRINEVLSGRYAENQRINDGCFSSYAAIALSCCNVRPMLSRPFNMQWRRKSSILKL